MLCPNCGTKTKTEHKFCRRCGMNLEPVSRALAEHLSSGGAPTARGAGRGTARPMMGGLFAGVIVMVILFGVLMMAFLPGKAFKVFGVATALVGIVAARAAVFSTLRTAGRAGEDDEAPAQPALEGEAATTGRLLHEQTAEPVPSVTERTTELLGVEAKDRKPQV